MAKVDLIPKTRKVYESNGFITARVEYYIAAMKHKNDLFGFIDVLAIHPKTKLTVGIQVTSVGNTHARIEKIAQIPYAYLLLEAGWDIQVVGWEKVNNRWRWDAYKITPEILNHYKTPQPPPPTTEVPVRTGAGEP